MSLSKDGFRPEPSVSTRRTHPLIKQHQLTNLCTLIWNESNREFLMKYETVISIKL